jgi:hypothetical protein
VPGGWAIAYDDVVESNVGQVERRTLGISETFNRSNWFNYIRVGTTGGAVAAFIFLAYQILLSSTSDVVAAFKMPASITLGQAAMSKMSPVVIVVATGLVNNVIIGAWWGLVFGFMLALAGSKWASGGIVTLAMVFGSLVWLLSFYLIAPLIWPWLRPLSSVRLFVGHVFFFGLPLGLWVASRIKS